MRISPSEKSRVRTVLRNRRRQITPAQQARAAAALAAHIPEIPEWKDAQRIALYRAFDGEIDPVEIAVSAAANGKTLYLPLVTDSPLLQFQQWQPDAPLTTNRYGLEQPPADNPIALAELDIVLVPMVAFDLAGNRLGMGGGYYDRALQDAPAILTVGLAHTCQQVDAIEPEAWDIPMDYIATDTALHRAAIKTKE
jgi:5-formyltetrahydrofolate cyclo-ligase